MIYTIAHATIWIYICKNRVVVLIQPSRPWLTYQFFFVLTPLTLLSPSLPRFILMHNFGESVQIFILNSSQYYRTYTLSVCLSVSYHFFFLSIQMARSMRADLRCFDPYTILSLVDSFTSRIFSVYSFLSLIILNAFTLSLRRTVGAALRPDPADDDDLPCNHSYFATWISSLLIKLIMI